MDEYPGVPRAEVRAAVNEFLDEPFEEAESVEWKRERWGQDARALAEQEQSEAVFAGATYGE